MYTYESYVRIVLDYLFHCGCFFFISFILIVACRLSFFFRRRCEVRWTRPTSRPSPKRTRCWLTPAPKNFSRAFEDGYCCSSCNSLSRVALPGVTSPGVQAGSRFGFVFGLLSSVFCFSPPPLKPSIYTLFSCPLFRAGTTWLRTL